MIIISFIIKIFEGIICKYLKTVFISDKTVHYCTAIILFICEIKKIPCLYRIQIAKRAKMLSNKQVSMHSSTTETVRYTKH